MKKKIRVSVRYPTKHDAVTDAAMRGANVVKVDERIRDGAPIVEIKTRHGKVILTDSDDPLNPGEHQALIYLFTIIGLFGAIAFAFWVF